jgi:hypothetical protein
VLEIADGAASSDFEAEVVAAVEAVRRQDLLLNTVASRVVRSLSDLGIPAAPLKGPLLGEAVYGAAGRRESSDIDLLVPAERLRDAVGVVREMGYRTPRDPVDKRGLPLLHFTMLHEAGEFPPVELHWRIHWHEENFARQQLLPPSPSMNWEPAPVDQLLALFAYYARDGFAGLRLATDLAAWWDARAGRFDPSSLAARLHAYPDLAPTFIAAGLAAERLVGLPAKSLYGNRFKPGRRAAFAARMARPLPRSSSTQIYAEMALVDGLLSPRKSLPDYRRRHFGAANEHGLRTVGRIALALLRAARPLSPEPDGGGTLPS